MSRRVALKRAVTEKTLVGQNKLKEISFFNQYASENEYNVFSERSNHKLVERCLALASLSPPARIADLGCGSGVFSSILLQKGFKCVGVDIAFGLTFIGHKLYPDLKFVNADIEALPFRSESMDAVLLSAVVHHLPDSTACAREVFRVIRPGGVFMAFDPNRLNPFMYLYRDRSSPFYSSKGVTENERPVLPWKIKRVFQEAGFEVRTHYISGLSYRYVASAAVRRLLPIYNCLDYLFMGAMGAFVITTGVKQEVGH